jgi:L-fucono-1,5-lactonase
VTRAAGVRWHAADLRLVAEVLLTAFGDDRVLFGSDWPVCLLSASYADVAATARDALSGASPGRVFGGNAKRWYRLP